MGDSRGARGFAGTGFYARGIGAVRAARYRGRDIAWIRAQQAGRTICHWTVWSKGRKAIGRSGH